MQITRIDFEGRPGHYATAQRKADCKQVAVEILLPGEDHPIHGKSAWKEECLFLMATRLQATLDGYKGSNSEVHDYYRELLRLSDL